MKILRLAIFFLLGFFCQILNAQTPYWQWAKGDGNTGHNAINQIRTDIHGNSYSVGYFAGASVTFATTTLSNPYPGTKQILVVKYDSSGSLQWARTIPSVRSAYATTVATDANDNVYVSGLYMGSIVIGTDTLTNDSIFSNNLFIAKYDASGNTVWARQSKAYRCSFYESNTTPTNMICDVNGNILIVGSFQYADSVSFGNQILPGINITAYPKASNFLVKYDALGNALWALTGFRDEGSFYDGICTDPAGNIYLSGYFHDFCMLGSDSSLSSIDQLGYYIWKFGPTGNSISSTTLLGAGNAFGLSPQICSDGENVFISGYLAPGAGLLNNAIMLGMDTLRATNGPLFLAKYSLSGNLIWAKTDGGATSASWSYVGTASLFNISNDHHGNIYVGGRYNGSVTLAGTSLVSAGQDDIFTAKYDTAGHAKWAISSGGAGNENMTICAAPNGDVYVAGASTSASLMLGSTILNNQSDSDIFIAKLSYYPLAVENTSSSPITIHPNPSTGTFYFTGLNPGSSIDIYDLLGQHIYSTTSDRDSAAIDLSAQSKGVYIYRISDQGSSQQGKIIKE